MQAQFEPVQYMPQTYFLEYYFFSRGAVAGFQIRTIVGWPATGATGSLAWNVKNARMIIADTLKPEIVCTISAKPTLTDLALEHRHSWSSA